jgi:ABC-type transport system involved in cytochrome c biogenesis ATPase subunit
LTTVVTVVGLLRHDAGEIAFHDGDGNRLDDHLARGREVHFLGHQDGLKTGRTARRELGFQCDWLGHTQTGFDHAVEAFGLEPLLDLEVRRLSAGQRRRLAMGRLVGSPRALWLLDEPMAPLDARWRDAVPDDFVFAVKGSRYITHMLRLRDAGTAMANFFASGVLALGPKLGPFLWQLPERQRRRQRGGSAEIGNLLEPRSEAASQTVLTLAP